VGKSLRSWRRSMLSMIVLIGLRDEKIARGRSPRGAGNGS
jgi:hypothetical protein